MSEDRGAANPVRARQLRHINVNGAIFSQRSPMLEIPLDQIALSLLRQALNVEANPEIVRAVVLRKLAGLYRLTPECELREALARAWASHRSDCRGQNH